ncbi:hypothetical protein FACS1894163_00610 [Spirochaetia bacterium]|nr:hypothetical protein FACS1894163_00610 [Spirochaetia bacterium]
MLDDITKRRIDSARDILVGKVPVPSSQVEQITIALIYKFMDDMDKESVSMGGKSSFFSGAYKKYAWSNIFDPRLGGFELINLYGEAIAKLNQNPNIPQLFRDIFKNAYLPYRDPETLKLFLKTINEFSYDHSEDLGDAFEYLLSVLDSQGDAGQFRTPRHIIDFMVAVVDPKKQETIIDPACGTAGFLISSYKHIRKANTGTTKAVQRPGDLLTPMERKKLLTNFKGYDISPDMVRLSLVNLYLHGFVQPQIYEYDTLTSEDRWNEYADVILANPPFMSPKGGIIPHKRFSVQSKRSEVLFVDYIAEHLTPTGRAAVIVPEGIIFQSGGAYKQLRKMLLEKYLYGVVSLPAGVFNPYSGVKTSILLLDRQIASKSDAVLFVKIENDGLALGAQRREIDKNDLPDALKVIRKFQKSPRVRTEGSPQGNTGNVLVVAKEKIAENGEYNLTGERYRVVERRGKQKWEMVRLGDVCEINPESAEPKELFGESDFVYIDITSVENDTGKVSFANIISTKDAPSRARRIVRSDDILISTVRPNLKAFTILNNLPENSIASTGFAVLRSTKTILPYYLYTMILSESVVSQMTAKMGKGAYPSINSNDVSNIIIPLPSINVQQEIVREIEEYQKVIDGARQVVDNWKPQIEVDPEWPMVKLGDVCENIKSGFACGKSEKEGGDILHLRPMNISSDGRLVFEGSKYVDKSEFDISYSIKSSDVLFNNTNSKELVGKTCYIPYDLNNTGFSNHMTRIRTKEELNSQYLSYVLQRLFEKGYFLSLCNKWIGQAGINNKILTNIEIPLPPLEVQREIVAKVEVERKVVDGCRELMIGYEGKIKRVVDGVWGE